MTDKKKYLLYIIIPLIILLIMASFPVSINMFGKSFSLKAEISRDNSNNENTVYINYDISETPNTFFTGGQQIDSYMYAYLEEKNGFYGIKDIKDIRPREGIYLRGRISYYSSEPAEYKPDDNQNKIYIYYDIQRYFLSKGEEGIKSGDKVKVNLKFFLGKTIVQGIEKIE